MKILLVVVLVSVFAALGLAQSASHNFDSAGFSKNLELANRFIECEFYTQLAMDKFSRSEDVSAAEWFSYKENKTWHTVAGNSTENTFKITKHVTFDSLNNISEYKGISDTALLNAAASAFAEANTRFQLIRDTSNLYFNSFVNWNPDQTISIWFLPAFQPSGQAIYGCEWEYIFDKTGRNLLRQNSFANIITGVWIGQPRELWLNYRNTDSPTVGSVFFAQSFRDYFTRIRIDTRTSTSTVTKDSNGNYIWTHKMK